MTRSVGPDPSVDEGAPTVLERVTRSPAPAGTFEARLERYELAEKLGEGGMASVQRARDVVTGEEVALKIIEMTTVFGTVSGSADDETMRARFERELRTAASLSHANVCRVISFGRAPGKLFLAMELVTGFTLQRLIETRATLPVAVALAVLRQLLRALEHAHAAQVVHRDIKPTNVMIAPDGTVKLLDFGIARSCGDATLTATGFLVGTPAYMAPEQTLGGAADARTDLFAAGITLYAMLTGQSRFPQQSPAVVMQRVGTEPVLPLLEECPIAPPAVDRFFGRLCAQLPAHRFSDATAALAALRDLPGVGGEEDDRALIARYQAAPVDVVTALSHDAAVRELARADALLQRGGAEPAAALALYRASLLEPSADTRRRLKRLCDATGITFDPLDGPEIERALAALDEDPTSFGVVKRVAELMRAGGNVLGAAVALTRALRLAPHDSAVEAQLSALIEGEAPARADRATARPPAPAPRPPSTAVSAPITGPAVAITVQEARATSHVNLRPLALLLAAGAVVALVFAGFRLFIHSSVDVVQQVSSGQEAALSRGDERALVKTQSAALTSAREHLAARRFSSAVRQATLLLASNPPAEEALEGLRIRADASLALDDKAAALADLREFLKQAAPNDAQRAAVDSKRLELESAGVR